MHKVCIIGIGFRPLEKRAHDALLLSDVVLSSSRLVDVFSRYAEYDAVSGKILVHKTVYEMLDYIAENFRRVRLCVLAAGDPMFFGIGRLVIERLGKEAVEVFPDLSSLQVAFARTGETSNNARMISLHGGPDPEKRRKLEYELSDLPSLVMRYEKIGILTDRENNPSVIAQTLVESSALFRFPASSLRMFVCERLGYDDEKITEGSPDEIARGTFEHPNVVVIVKRRDETSTLPGFRTSGPVFGLKEEEFQYTKGLITKDEVRAVTIHKLRLPDEGVFWDIGAGSGSVAIEAARLCHKLNVYAMEKDAGRIDIIRRNILRLGISNIQVIDGAAPEILADLPLPDRVFIGGSGGRMKEIMDVIGHSMSAGIVVVNASTIETLNEAVEGLQKNNFSIEITEVTVSRSKEIAGKRHMSALNPVFIIRGEKR